MGAADDGRGPRPRRNGRRRSLIELCVAGIETGDLTAAGRPEKTHVAFHNLTPEKRAPDVQAAQVIVMLVWGLLIVQLLLFRRAEGCYPAA